MKKVLKFIVMLVGVIAIIGIIAAALSDKGSKKAEVKSSASSVPSNPAPSVVTSKVDTAKVRQLKSWARFKKDEFKGTVWVEPKDRPEYRNQNSIYCYFSQEGNDVGNFRLVIQYAGDEWLFIKKYDFLIDGKPYSLLPTNVERDNSETVWEWTDEAIGFADADLIEALAGAKTVKVRFEGQQYYKEKIISPSQIKSIKNMLGLYTAMGGTL
jgi:hypothetical protein